MIRRNKEYDSSEVYDILALAFDGRETAETIQDKAGDAGLLEDFDSIARAVVERDEYGNVHVHDQRKGGIRSASIGRLKGVGYASG